MVLDHIGIGVESLVQALEIYKDKLNLQHMGTHDVPTEKVRVAMLELGDTRIELLEPTSNDSPVSQFLKKRGGGIHHLAFRVMGIVQEVARLRKAGMTVIDPAPRPGADGTQVAFIHPKSTGGILIELVAHPPKF